MPRKYTNKTNRAPIDEQVMKQAIKASLRNEAPVREISRIYNVNRNTLVSRLKSIKRKEKEEDYVRSSDSGLSEEDNTRKFHSKYSVTQVFSIREEENLVAYIKKSSQLHYGLSYRQIRCLAYEYARNIPNSKMPPSWSENEMAGKLRHYFFFNFPNLSCFRKRLVVWVYVKTQRFVFKKARKYQLSSFGWLQ